MTKVSKEKDAEYAARYRAKNRKAIRERMNAWNRANRNKRKSYALKENYGITMDDYSVMLRQQNHCCKICKGHESSFTRALHVDHCHSTGKVRGLLCKECNLLLGRAKDNIAILKQAIEYLEDI